MSLRLNDRPVLTISVRDFVEFLLRSGNIDNRIKGSKTDVLAMQEGARIHRLLQRRMGSDYHAEVSLSHVTHFDEYDIKVEGRADGIIEGDTLTVDEIKTVHKELIYVNSYEPVHMAQAKCYAYFLLKYMQTLELCQPTSADDTHNKTQNNNHKLCQPDTAAVATNNPDAESYNTKLCKFTVSEAVLDSTTTPTPAGALSTIHTPTDINIRITYCNADSLECKYFHENYTFKQLETFFTDLINEYKKWADFEFSWAPARNKTIEALTFPFEYREGQKELVGQIYKSIDSGDRLFVEAPTGTGKTIAAVYPSLKALSEGKAKKIFYLTAKTITRTAACDCLDILRKKALSLKSVVITAKEKICMCDEVQCNPDYCPCAKGHFDRINDAVYDLLIHEDSYTREKILEYAGKHSVCPFEMNLDMSLFSDMIICDYNYVFDPNVYLRRYFSDMTGGEYIFLIDEAHNLAERAMSMYSADLLKEDFLSVKQMVKPFSRRLASSIETCNKKLLVMKREITDIGVLTDISEFIVALLKCQGQLEKFLDEIENFPDNESVLDFYFKVRHFLNMYENMTDEDYIIYDLITEKGQFMLKLLCTNPARSIRLNLDKGISTIFFSATLLPIQYFKDMLTGDDDNAVYAKSIFDEKKRGLFVASDVSSKYTRRNEAEFFNIASYIYNTVKANYGNYIVFFPSYSFLNEVLKIYDESFSNDDIKLLIQKPYMNEDEREGFLKCFEGGITDESFSALLGFCVMGGIFSEGVDLRGENLIGVIVVGTGLPMVTKERELLKRKYDEEGFNGYDYAYKYPGMNKVMQAAGRVIRTEDDIGVVVLLDERFLTPSYLKLFPREWSGFKRISLHNAADGINDFWKEMENYGN